MNKVLVHTLTARLLHWLNMLAITLLTLSGFYIHAPLVFSVFPSMDKARLIHFTFMYIVIFSVGFRIFYAFRQGEAGEIAFHPRDIKGIPGLIRYYLFVSDRMPDYGKFNPGQKAMYTAWALLIGVQGITGFILYWPGPLGYLGYLLGGLAMVRLVHYLITWIFVCTVIVHVYLVFISGFEVFKSMITGYIPQNQAHGGQ